MKNAIGAVIILFVVYLHLLVVPPRNLRGQYYKNRPARGERTCDVEYDCNEDAPPDICNQTYSPPDTNECYGVCLTQTTEDLLTSTILFRGRRCIEYCEDYCSEIIEGYMSCFSCN